MRAEVILGDCLSAPACRSRSRRTYSFEGRAMRPQVLSPREKAEVADGVIELIFVPVMNDHPALNRPVMQFPYDLGTLPPVRRTPSVSDLNEGSAAALALPEPNPDRTYWNDGWAAPFLELRRRTEMNTTESLVPRLRPGLECRCVAGRTGSEVVPGHLGRTERAVTFTGTRARPLKPIQWERHDGAAGFAGLFEARLLHKTHCPAAAAGSQRAGSTGLARRRIANVAPLFAEGGAA